MEDFDVFTNEINYTKSFYSKVLHSFINNAPSTPNGPNYQSGRKLLAEEFLVTKNDLECAFNFSEAVSASVRTMAVYREEQMKRLGDTSVIDKISSYIKPIQEIHDSYNDKQDRQIILPKEEQEFISEISAEVENVSEELNKISVEHVLPFHERYLRFTHENNSQNFVKILKEMPEEWTIIQLTAPYNPNENLKPLSEYRVEINSLYLSLFTNDYLEDCNMGPLTVNLPAKFKEGVRPLFTELYMILDENYKTIDNAQFLNNKRLVQNYWSKREDIDLRMKSVINSMSNEWLVGWCCLLTGKLQDKKLKEKIIKFVDNTIEDWGFLKLTLRQRFFLYNLFGSCASLSSNQIKHCIRSILTEHGNTEEIREALTTNVDQCCNTNFLFLNELCYKCQAKGFEMVNKFTLVDGIKAFYKAATQIQEEDEWAKLKKAKRHPVILIVDEMLDTFPWESLPILNYHPVSRMENIHFIYYLYKLHENDIVDGYFLAKPDAGRYIINPEKNLDRMEKRMGSFVRYWCAGWHGLVGEQPQPEHFLQYLNDADIFLYCGHGDGCALGAGGVAGGAGVEGARGRRVALLAGCGSARLAHPPGRAPPSAAHHALHIAHSPMVIGMLWEVTDLEVDKVISTLVALCVPSEAKPAWPSVGKTKWSQGILDTNGEQNTPFVPEYNLLRAVSRARGSTNYVMIASSVVARGLPVRIRKS